MEKLTNEFKIEYVKGDTYALAIKFKNITEDLSKAFLTVKENPDDSPVIQKSLGAGIDKIDDRAYKNEKTYKVQLQPADTVNIEPKVQYLYDIQVTVGNVVKTVLHGVFILNSTITGTSSVTTQEAEVEIDDELETELATTPATNGVEYEQDPVACAKIGDLTTLITTNKDTIVKAVNEIKKGVSDIEDGTTIVPKATEVLNKINGKSITDIFEDDGTTVKNSSNVTGKINGNLISNIFEENGTTVKNASNSANATKVNNIEITQDDNGFYRIGGKLIPQKKEIWSGDVVKSIATPNAVLSLFLGEYIEIDPNGKYVVEGYNNYFIGSAVVRNSFSFTIDKSSKGPGGETDDRNGPLSIFCMSCRVSNSDYSETYAGKALCNGKLYNEQYNKQDDTRVYIDLIQGIVSSYTGEAKFSNFSKDFVIGITKIYQIIE